MKHIKKFNESKDENSLNYLKDEIIDILQDSFLKFKYLIDLIFHSSRY